MIPETVTTTTTLTVDRHVVGDRTDVRVGGELSVRTAAALRRDLHAWSAGALTELHVDLSDVTVLDAAGLVAVSAPLMAARRFGIATAVTPPVADGALELANRSGILPLLGARQ
jgi:anti-anti-sigma regulatory factor